MQSNLNFSWSVTIPNPHKTGSLIQCELCFIIHAYSHNCASKLVYRILRYAKGTFNLGFHFTTNTTLDLCAFSDAD